MQIIVCIFWCINVPSKDDGAIKKAEIAGADFTEANLEGATLTDSYIIFDDFSLANLSDANLDRAITVFGPPACEF